MTVRAIHLLKKTPLKNIASSSRIPDDVKSNIPHYKERGQICFEELLKDRLLISIWNPMKKSFLNNWMEKTRIRVGDKVTKLREERQLLGQFLSI